MTVQRQVGKDEPVMIAWTAYQKTEDFANTKRWATHAEHVQGSLWAAFSTGFHAGQRAVEPSTPPPDLAAMRRVVEAAERLYIASDQNLSAETDAFGNLLYAVAVYRGDEEVRAQEADHDR